MGTKRGHIILLLLLGGIASLELQCKKFGCAENVYSFEIGIKAYPDNDSVKVGDTIWLDVNEPTTLKDGETGNIADYGGAANLGSVMNFDRLSQTNEFNEAAADKFVRILISGTEVESRNMNHERQYLFDEANELFIFKLGIIAKDTGTFSVLFSDAANVYRNHDKCTKASFAIRFKNTDQHYYLSPFYNGDTTIRGGDYYFKVY